MYFVLGGGGNSNTRIWNSCSNFRTANNVNNPYPHKENTILPMAKRPTYSENKAPLYIFFMGVDKRIFLPLPCGRPNTMRTTSTLLKNLNHHDAKYVI